MAVGDLFDNKEVARHTYYMVGFMCQAGAKEAKRRTANNDVGVCIGAIDRHFVKAGDESDVEEIKAQLPEGLTDMVDRRNGLGGLTYPRPLAYQVFGLVEYVYSHLAVVKNLNLYGGTLLSKIRTELCANKDVVELFSNFFDEDEFPPETIQTALEYYVKVFSNLRAKDLCYRLNANIAKGPTVGLRQQICSAKKTGKRSSKKTKRRQKKAAKEYESSDEENVPFCYSEDELDDNQQHEDMLDVATEEDEDAEDTGAKECSPYDVENEAYAEKFHPDRCTDDEAYEQSDA